jgi:hypothetical protein
MHISHIGMPSLRGLGSRIGPAERIPPKLFYIPLALHWLWLSLRYRSLSLPALANPLVETGGLWGESKRAYLDMVSGDERRWLARYITLTRGRIDATRDTRQALELMRANNLSFPIVAKPDIGWQGYGVRPITSEPELRAYIAAFPKDATLMLQEMVAWDGEAGVFYVRQPREERGRIMSLTFRYYPHVVGDGVRTARELVLAGERTAWKAGVHLGRFKDHVGAPSRLLDQVPQLGESVRLSFIGSIRVGSLYRDVGEKITPALTERFDAISRSMPEFHYGRYDVRFASSDALQQGDDVRIIEINGAGSEVISAWDPEMTIRRVYASLLMQQRLLFQIGAQNRARGWEPPSPYSVLRAAWQQTRLIRQYPASR